MTTAELIDLLRIPEVSTASNHNNVIKNLIRFRDLPRIHIGRKLLFPRSAVLEWIKNQTIWK
jgi:predicted DNA-binding transcriptional regulator AlpA